jgi:hypothetical protein
MSMTLDEAINLFESMDNGLKAQLLGRLCFERLKGINEIQHKSLGQMLAYQSGRSDRYPDRDFFLLLVKLGKSYGVAGRVQQSLIGQLQKAS